MNNDRYYLLTGAAGFLGSNICLQLLEKGCKVRALVLPNDKSVKFIPKDVEVVIGDLTDEASLESFFSVPEGCSSVIIHCASMVTVDPTFSVYNLARNNVFDYSKAQRELGYTTRPYQETIHDEVQWLIAEGLIEA